MAAVLFCCTFGDGRRPPRRARSQLIYKPLLPLTVATPDRKDRRLLQFQSMMQNRRDLPGRIIFTVGVDMSSMCVAFILILWVGGRQ